MSFGSTALATTSLLMLALIGCDHRAGAPAAAPEMAAVLPAALFASQPPGESVELRQAIVEAKDGEAVIVRAVVGGRREPFVPNRAVMVVADASVTTCCEIPGDNCPTPWDYCCVPREELAGKTASIEVTDDDGQPLRASLNSAGGLAPLKTVVVKGVVRREDAQGGSGTLAIRASQIYVEP